ncbi:MAG TPA: hypothetical protein VGD69_09780 [Herpetosiphonaceae bacterium]
MWLFGVLTDVSAAPLAHGEGIHALLEPLLFVVVAGGVWMFTRLQNRRIEDGEQETVSNED